MNYIKEDTLRTVTWTSTTWTGPKTQSYDSHPRDTSFQYNVTNQLNRSMRLRFAGSNFRADGNLGLPTIDNNQRERANGPEQPAETARRERQPLQQPEPDVVQSASDDFHPQL